MAGIASILRLLLLAIAAYAGYVYLTGAKEEAAPAKICYTVEGYRGCGYFERAKAMGNQMKSDDRFQITIRESPQRSEYVGERLPELNRVVAGAGSHRTSPFVYQGCDEKKTYVGGAMEFLAHVKKEYGIN